MRAFKYEYQSDFAKEYIALGRVEGVAQGRVEVIQRQLTIRFGELDNDAKARIASATADELNVIGERLLTAKSLQEALG